MDDEDLVRQPEPKVDLTPRDPGELALSKLPDIEAKLELLEANDSTIAEQFDLWQKELLKVLRKVKTLSSEVLGLKRYIDERVKAYIPEGNNCRNPACGARISPQQEKCGLCGWRQRR